MEGDPVAVGLKFGFLGVLYLFLFWVARSSLKDLRGRNFVAEGATGLHQIEQSTKDAWLVVLRGGGLDVGERFDLFGGLTIGRSADADIRIEDRYASGIHVRVFHHAGRYVVEDMGSTNGTYLNEHPLTGEADLGDLDQIRIGDTELRFELQDAA